MQRKNGRRKKIAYVLCGILAVVLFSGCQSTAADGTDKKVFVYGDTTFNAENDESDVNPHNGYSGWACIRYGIGETLFHYSDSMEIEPWLAESYEIVDDTTWRITLHEGISFTSGRTLDAEAVKECLEDLIAVHDRARGDLKIESIEADGLIVTIHTEQPVPALLNYLSDPYGCIIDMQAGVTDDGNVAGTGPYRAVQVETDQGLTLVKNDNYWNGTPKLDRIEVKTIRDGDTMTMALQSGELDAAYGLPYSNLILFRLVFISDSKYSRRIIWFFSKGLLISITCHINVMSHIILSYCSNLRLIIFAIFRNGYSISGFKSCQRSCLFTDHCTCICQFILFFCFSVPKRYILFEIL